MNGDLEKAAQPHGLRAPEIKLDDKEHLDPHNDYLPSQKLDYALQMAEAVAVLRKCMLAVSTFLCIICTISSRLIFLLLFSQTRTLEESLFTTTFKCHSSCSRPTCVSN